METAFTVATLYLKTISVKEVGEIANHCPRRMSKETGRCERKRCESVKEGVEDSVKVVKIA